MWHRFNLDYKKCSYLHKFECFIQADQLVMSLSDGYPSTCDVSSNLVQSTLFIFDLCSYFMSFSCRYFFIKPMNYYRGCSQYCSYRKAANYTSYPWVAKDWSNWSFFFFSPTIKLLPEKRYFFFFICFILYYSILICDLRFIFNFLEATSHKTAAVWPPISHF